MLILLWLSVYKNPNTSFCNKGNSSVIKKFYWYQICGLFLMGRTEVILVHGVMSLAESRPGLENVVALTSELCYIDGAKGILRYRGYPIEELAEQSTFEEVIYLLWNGELPTSGELTGFKSQLRDRELPNEVLEIIKQVATTDTAMATLRTAVSALSGFDPDRDDDSYEASVRKATRLVAKIPTIVAATGRVLQGKEPLVPNPELDIAANFVYMLNGEEPNELVARTMDVALVLHADHGLNASTFAARVTASTLADIYSAVVSAICALNGPLHGGANERVMKMLLEIGEVDRAEEWVLAALARKERIMGVGHRVYKVLDPRAPILRDLALKMGETLAGTTKWVDMSMVIQEVMKREKGLNPNVDFYSASTYYTMGIPTELFTPIFAVSRISGWAANILEQYRDNRLIRPRAAYEGPEVRSYVPIEDRS